MNRPLIKKARGGEYSTVQIGDVIETLWFGDDGTARTVGRAVVSLAKIQAMHIEADTEGRD